MFKTLLLITEFRMNIKNFIIFLEKGRAENIFITFRSVGLFMATDHVEKSNKTLKASCQAR